MIHFLVHITTETEVARLPYIRHQLSRCFPESRLHVINQTLIPIPDSVLCENIKYAGFGWTLRFLQMAKEFMQPGDLLIKIDPDIDIKGNPLDGLPPIPADACFGQTKLIQEVPVFLGGFQGFGFEAVQELIEAGQPHENEIGRQDVILYRIGAGRGLKFISLPWIDLWSSRDNYDPNCKIISWRRDVPRI